MLLNVTLSDEPNWSELDIVPAATTPVILVPSPTKPPLALITPLAVIFVIFKLSLVDKEPTGPSGPCGPGAEIFTVFVSLVVIFIVSLILLLVIVFFIAEPIDLDIDLADSFFFCVFCINYNI